MIGWAATFVQGEYFSIKHHAVVKKPFPDSQSELLNDTCEERRQLRRLVGVPWYIEFDVRAAAMKKVSRKATHT